MKTLAHVMLLSVIGFACAAPSQVEAAYSADVMAAYSNCLVGCDDTQESCSDGCCIIGGRLCSSRCLNNCQTAETACQEQCSVSAFGSFDDGAFFEQATLARNGRTVHLGGPFSCPEGGAADLDVILTQHRNGTVGRGYVRVPCLSETTFSVDVHTTGAARFVPFGAAQACGVAHIQGANQSIDAFQWCRDVTIVPDGFELED